MSRIVNVVSDNSVPLPIYLHTVDSYHNQENIYSSDARRNFYQILIIRSGSGILRYGGETYKLKKGCAFFTGMNDPVEYINTGGLVSAYVTVRGRAVDMMLSHFGYGEFLFYESVNVKQMISAIEAVMNEYNSHRRESELSLMLYAFFMRFFEKDREDNLQPLDRVVLHMEKYYMEKLTLTELAKINKSSLTKLCSDFKKRFGCTVFDYLISYRLSTARELLRIDDCVSTKEAALSAGFEDVSYFCRVYKKKYGITPSEDRKQIGNV